MKSFGQTNALSGNLGLSFDSKDRNLTACPPIECGGTINGGDTASLSLRVIGEAPDEIYLLGTACIALAKFGTIVNAPIGGGGGNFKVDKPNPTTLVTGGNVKGTWQKSDGTASIPYEIEFKLPMPWDGTSANWTGTWSISWTA